MLLGGIVVGERGGDEQDRIFVDHRRDRLDRRLDSPERRSAHDDIGDRLSTHLAGIGERDVAANMDRVIKELQSAGAIVVDVAIADYDEKYAAARGSAPGSLRAGWEAYLSRGAKPGDTILTIQELLASGKLAPVSARRFEGALAPVPTGTALDEATRRFFAGREAFRQIFVDLMDQQKLEALLFPANQARPHTHEGGLERYGSEPGTCEESAATGLPQVTVPAGFIGGRYPVGVSLLGRMWDDKRLLELAAAYERATHHRRPPTTVK